MGGLSDKLKGYTNHTGGAYGVDTFGCIIGIHNGFSNHKHYRSYDNPRLSKKLKDRGIVSTILKGSDIDSARDTVNEILGTNFKDSISGNLQARNLYQVMNSDAVYCFSEILDKESISGGTNTAFRLAVHEKKPVFVFDIKSLLWHKFDYDINILTLCDAPTLTKEYAIVGTRNVEDYSIKDKRTGLWGSRPQYVGRVVASKVKSAIDRLYKDTINSLIT